MKKGGGKFAAFVIASAMLWGMFGSFVTVITGMGMDRNVLNFLRFLATAVPVLLLILPTDRSQLSLRRRDIPWFLANGFASILFFTSCYTMAIQETKIATAAALLYTAPVIVMVLSAVLFQEKMNLRKVICIVLSVIGCALVSGIAGGLGLTVRGLFLGLGAGLGYALYSIFSRIILDKGYSVYTNIFYTFSLAAVAYLLLSLGSGHLSQITAMPAAAAVSLLCGLLTGTCAYVLYTVGLTGMEASRAAQLATIEPVTAAVLGVVLFGQTLRPVEILGILLVVGSVVFMNTNPTGDGR